MRKNLGMISEIWNGVERIIFRSILIMLKRNSDEIAKNLNFNRWRPMSKENGWEAQTCERIASFAIEGLNDKVSSSKIYLSQHIFTRYLNLFKSHQCHQKEKVFHHCRHLVMQKEFQKMIRIIKKFSNFSSPHFSSYSLENTLKNFFIISRFIKKFQNFPFREKKLSRANFETMLT